MSAQREPLRPIVKVPDFERPIQRSGDKIIALWADCAAAYTCFMTTQCANLEAGFDLPDDERGIFRGGDNIVAAGADHAAMHVLDVPGQDGTLLAGFGIPDIDLPALSCRHNKITRRADCAAIDGAELIGIIPQDQPLCAGLNVPYAHRGVPTRRDDPVAEGVHD